MAVRMRLWLIMALMLLSAPSLMAQEKADSVQLELKDSASVMLRDTALLAKPFTYRERWRPDPKKSMWLALVIPGGGQIYNRKYWKLPIVYGGFMGCAYALSWNNMMYKDYSQAYLDIMDDDPNTKSYEDFLPYNVKVDSSNLNRYQTILKRKKDYYRKYRDMSIFAFIGVYLLSVVDAYVDAELSSFDINDDLSLKIEPAIINRDNGHTAPFTRTTNYGVQCSLRF